MRCIVVGTILSLMLSVAAWGQVEGSVESVGFNRWYRSNCWTPMRVLIKPTTIAPGNYKLQVFQEDLDKDHALFTRRVSIGKEAHEYWTYFIPQPTRIDGGNSVAELAKDLKVWLCTESGRQLVQLDVSPAVLPLQDLDREGGRSAASKGRRLVLVLRGDENHPPTDYCYRDGVLGTTEQVTFQTVSPRDLPENVLGYQSVDAILWMGMDPNSLKSELWSAMEQYVRQGGKLVVCQRSTQPELYVHDVLARMLPVATDSNSLKVDKVDGRLGLSVLRSWMAPKLPRAINPALLICGTTRPANPFPLATAQPKPGAIVTDWIGDPAPSPYVVRWLYGYGTVTWVAQDFGEDPFQIRRMLLPADAVWMGVWAGVWDRIFDWANQTVVNYDPARPTEAAKGLGGSNGAYTSTVDLSRAGLKEMELPHRGVALVGLAVAFFIIYWLAAGPGSYWALAKRKRAYLSWFAYGLCAVAATALTVLVVRWVLGGANEVHHVSFVRWAAGQDAIVHSDLGLYIPRDGEQTIELADVAPESLSYLTPYPLHPEHWRDSAEFTSPMEYEVAIRDRTSEGPPQLVMPYRSTLKKLQARWVGPIPPPVEMSGLKLTKAGPSGGLANHAGRDLHQVYIAYNDGKDDLLFFVPDVAGKPAWPKDGFIDLGQLYGAAKQLRGKDEENIVGSKDPLWSAIGQGWAWHWTRSLSPRGTGMTVEDAGDLNRAVLLMSLFDRLPPSKSEERDPNNRNPGHGRYELLRPAGRFLDVSAALGAGQLVVLAQSDRNVEDAKGPLPFPLLVHSGLFGTGDKVSGEGMTYYQFILPIDRSTLPPTTYPVQDRPERR